MIRVRIAPLGYLPAQRHLLASPRNEMPGLTANVARGVTAQNPDCADLRHCPRRASRVRPFALTHLRGGQISA